MATVTDDEVKRRIDQYNAIHGIQTPVEPRGFELPSVDEQKIRRQKVRDPSKYSIGTKIALLIDFSDLDFEDPKMDTKEGNQGREYWTILAKIKDRALHSPILQGQGTVYELQHLDKKQWNYHQDPKNGQWVGNNDIDISGKPGINLVFSHNSKDCPKQISNCPFDAKRQQHLRYYATVDNDGKRASLIFTSSVVDFQDLHDDLTNDANPGIVFAEYPIIAVESFDVTTTVVKRQGPRIKFNRG